MMNGAVHHAERDDYGYEQHATLLVIPAQSTRRADLAFGIGERIDNSHYSRTVMATFE